MIYSRKLLNSFLIVSILFLLPATACFAQATRTWVSGVGDDANPCSRTAPCKTFAGAISKTAAGGIINALDSAGFGAVTITKSIEIEATGVVAGVLASGTNGIIVNAAATDSVTLRGLSLNGIGTGLNGVRLLSASKLLIENSTVDGFTQNGIDIEPSANSQIVMRNVVVRGSGNAGVFVQPSGGATSVDMDNVNLSNGKHGLLAFSSKASIKNSVITANKNDGVSAASTAKINVNDSLISDNGGSGVRAANAGSIVYVSHCSITGNATGLLALTSGVLTSYGNNRVFENTTNGIFTSTLMEQ